MQKEDLLNTREVAHFLDINEKVVYHLITDKGLPATKVTGKWLFPKHLVERWLESETTNFPKAVSPLPPYHGLLIISGSNDLLLDRTISLFNRLFPDHFAVFGNVGSQGGLSVLGRGLCHIAASHLLQDGYHIRTVQELLGNKDVSTTMIYTHVLNRGGKGVRSPPDVGE